MRAIIGLMPIIAGLVLAIWMVIAAIPPAGERPPGGIEIAPEAPVQRNIDPVRLTAIEDAEVTALAEFSLQARVLSRKPYRLGREARYSPIDIAFGWGPMSDTEVLDRLEISQGNRWYRWRYQSRPPLSNAEIARNSANMHLIPADEAVRDVLMAAGQGTVLEMTGHLVRLDAPDGWHWVSSLSRTDRRAGACEVVHVTSARPLPAASP